MQMSCQSVVNDIIIYKHPIVVIIITIIIIYIVYHHHQPHYLHTNALWQFTPQNDQPTALIYITIFNQKPTNEHEELGEFLYMYLQRRFGVENMIVEWGYNLHDACNRYSHDPRIGLFYRILQNEVRLLNETKRRFITQAPVTQKVDVSAIHWISPNQWINLSDILNCSHFIRGGYLSQPRPQGPLFSLFSKWRTLERPPF